MKHKPGKIQFVFVACLVVALLWLTADAAYKHRQLIISTFHLEARLFDNEPPMPISPGLFDTDWSLPSDDHWAERASLQLPPIAFDQVLLFKTDYDYLVCLDKKTGKEKWIKKFQTSTSLTKVGNLLLCTTDWRLPNLYVIDPLTGQRVWEYLEGSRVGSNILNENIDSCSVVRGDKIYILTSNGWFNCLNASNGHSICKGKIANKFDLGFRWGDNSYSWGERHAELNHLAKHINENAKAAGVQVNDVLDAVDDKIFARGKGKLKCFQRQSLKLLWAVDNFEQYRCYDNLLWAGKVANRTIVIAKLCPDPHLRPESPYESRLRRDEEPYKRSHNYYKRKIAVFDGLSGAEIWSKVIPGFYQFYITDDEKIFALGDRLECLNCSDGNLLWSYTPPLVSSPKIREMW